MFRPKNEDNKISILRALPEDVLVEIVKYLDSNSVLNLKTVEKFFSQSKKINDALWLALMKDQFGFPNKFAMVSEDKRLLFARLKYIFWRQHSLCIDTSYLLLAAELRACVEDDTVKPHELGWLLYTNPVCDRSYINYIDHLTLPQKIELLKKAILADNHPVVGQVLCSKDLALTNKDIQQLGRFSAESGDVDLVKKIIVLAKQHGFELDPTFTPNLTHNMYDAAVLSGSVELVQYLHEQFHGIPTFNWGVGSLAVLEYCQDHYEWQPDDLAINASIATGSVEFAKKCIALGSSLSGSNKKERVFFACHSGNLKMIDYCCNDGKNQSFNYGAIGGSGNANTCIELLKRLDEDFDEVARAFFEIYESAVMNSQCHVITTLEDYYTKALYPGFTKMAEGHPDALLYEGLIEHYKDPINVLHDKRSMGTEQLLAEIACMSCETFSEKLCLRILTATPEDREVDPWSIERIAIRFGSEKVLDYCLERWKESFSQDVFLTISGSESVPKFTFVKYLIEHKGFKPDQEAIDKLCKLYNDEAVNYFSAQPEMNPSK